MFILDFSLKEYNLFEDLAEVLGLEGNYDAMKFVRNQVKEAGIKGRVCFDSENDCLLLFV
ncbi:hypothetical protein COA08_24500 [Bacillus cereus]|uniref:Uncharacterized protein n=2 Tax=Bacillus cereus TaxID=1396 RepID=A0A2B1DTW5_BACCE|nr:hypothetical protein CON06_07040 [Bacillus cereus]PFA16526.1 hypothetical protein CN382_05690 [Bacillus cereus]PFM42539.1 hypothetical protein COJ43_00915 [Bacillus cereus]PGL59518.1 hypothetical protein CN927_17620 [Bacillus cereus]PGQ06108.1 hypothetical protein COA08_24500 [Bacillus cereus]